MKASEREDICIRCARCCRNLSLYDMFLLSIRTRSIIWSGECKHLTKDNLCKVYGDRHQLCRDWECGLFVIENEKD
ncbi:hypothetical protein LCGC14_1029670 [marine sediment metagenome]|uniref:YkgJ family cysteine cluster protein n=1 Tax=marine sediment metagenome TaxID=412755 RepID=A0A0F9MUZ2_9ZZZZ